jgi:hypothetical protein
MEGQEEMVVFQRQEEGVVAQLKLALNLGLEGVEPPEW